MVYKGRAEVDMPLHHFRRQYEQRRIIGMMEAGWSARLVALQLDHSDCVVRRCWDQWIQEMSFTQRPGSGCPQQTSREDRHIIRNVRIQPTSSSTAIQAQVAPSLDVPVSSRTIRRPQAEGHLRLRCSLRVLPSRRPPINTSVWSGAVHEETGLQRNGTRSPDSISTVITILFVCGDPVVNASILPLLNSDTPLPLQL
ncbi:transposable element Tcb1 transposase [Trichonephila clavipes]|nr:transposable element Tcb1 transposase [Trichonephila clavipes]